jgi:hypothetical protein
MKQSMKRIPLSQEWNDYNLRWNVSEFGGVKDLRIPPKNIWKPDVLMYNRSLSQRITPVFAIIPHILFDLFIFPD